MKKNIIIIVSLAVVIAIIFGVIAYKSGLTKNSIKKACTQEAKICPDGSAVGRIGPNCEFAACPAEDKKTNGKFSEAEARAIAEKTCIKGGESLSSGYYNENSKTWWFDANLNAAQEGCNPACVVSEATKSAEINWRCTGLKEPAVDQCECPSGYRKEGDICNPECYYSTPPCLAPSFFCQKKESAEEIKNLFVKKYPKYAKTVSVIVGQETANHARGSVSFEAGEPGGIFLAAKIDGKWQIVFDGNGQIPCNLSKYGFPSEMLSDCN